VRRKYFTARLNSDDARKPDGRSRGVGVSLSDPLGMGRAPCQGRENMYVYRQDLRAKTVLKPAFSRTELASIPFEASVVTNANVCQ
jgi:hypothetical protein